MTKEFDSLYLKADAKVHKPFFEGKSYLCNGEIRAWTGETCKVRSPVLIQGSDQENALGK
jgi:hypothetical protein